MAFLRAIRRQFLENGAMKKYMIYALVEVFLVMVGILLALQVDDWHNQRLDRQAERTSYENIKDQIALDKERIAGQINYDGNYLEQFIYAFDYLGRGVRQKEMKDTLGVIARNMLNYSDFDQQGNIYETLVNSGQSKLLSNHNILQRLQQLEGQYLYINRMENIHYDAIMTHVIPATSGAVDYATTTIMEEDKIYDYRFRNLLGSLIHIMREKKQVYENTIRNIDEITMMIEEELGSN